MQTSTAFAILIVLSAYFAAPVYAASTYERAPITTERGTCIPGEHLPLRVRKMPGSAVSSDSHREPDEDAYVHCSNEGGEREPVGRLPGTGKEPKR